MIFEQKKSKNAYIMHIILATNTIFSDLMPITLPKLHVKLQPHPPKHFSSKGGKNRGAKNAKIMHNYAN